MYRLYSASFIVCMPYFLPDCIERVDLVDLVVADQRADRRRHDENLRRHRAARPFARRQQRLRDDPLEHERELRAHLRLLVAREDVDDAVDRLGRASSCAAWRSARWPVSAIVSAAWIVSRSRISPIRMTSGSSRSAYLSAAREALRVGADLALVDDAALVAVDELDRIFDRDDVAAYAPC